MKSAISTTFAWYVMKIKRWTLIFRRSNKNATHWEEEHCMTSFCANSTIVQQLKTKKKTKGRWTGWWFTAVHATLANQQPQYLREVHKSAPKRLSKVWTYDITVATVCSPQLYTKLFHSLHTIMGGINDLRHCFSFQNVQS